MKISKAVILAAGRGTRFLPYTKACPKEMLPIVDTPALQLIVDEVVAAGITQILIVISPEKEVIKKHFSEDVEFEHFLKSRGKNDEASQLHDIATKADISFAFQKVADGSGSALLLAEDFLNGEPAVVLNGDDLICSDCSATKQLVDCFEKCSQTIIGVQVCEPENISKFGVVNIVNTLDEKTFSIDKIVEKPLAENAPSLFAAFGRYVISSDFFEFLKATPISSTGELQLTDALNIQAKKQGAFAYAFDGVRYDLGDRLGYLKAVVAYALEDETLAKPFSDHLCSLRFTLKK